MSWTRLAANTIMVCASCLVAILLVEVIYRLAPFQGKESIYRWELRYILFSNDDGRGVGVFRNIGNLFTYQPNARIHNTGYYFVSNRWIKEYDYIIPTNNFGLVQTNDIRSHKPSMLLLGDSCTEGQGASPWFELFRKSNPLQNMQPINGGLIGTGFRQWQLLHDYLLGEGIEVKKLVVVFISSDYVRNVWNFPVRTHDCLADYRRCTGNEDFYGTPADKGELQAFLEKLRGYREEHLFKKDSPFKEKLHSLFPGTRLALRFVREGIKKLRTEEMPDLQANRETIHHFIKAYKDDVLFVHIPQKDEILDHEVNPLGKTIRKEIEVSGGQYYDGQALCGLTGDDFFPNDGHPNANGYSKISACVTDAVNRKWPHE